MCASSARPVSQVDDQEPVEGNTALIEAARNGHTETVKELLKHGATIGLANQMQQTPMRVAVRGGHEETVQALVRHGAEVREPRGWTALLEASRLGHAGVISVLVAEHVRGGVGEAAPGGVNTTNMIGETALMLAAGQGDVTVTQTLLAVGANVDAQDSQGSTALMKASGAGHAQVAGVLMESGAEVNTADDAGHTAVLYASRHGHFGVLRALIDYGAAAYTHGGKRMFQQPSWGPAAINAESAAPGDGRFAFAMPASLLSGRQQPPPQQWGGRGVGSSAQPGHGALRAHALDLGGVSTLKTRGTLGGSKLAGQLSLPDIRRGAGGGGGRRGERHQATSGSLVQRHAISHGDSDYAQAKRKLLEDIFGPPPKVVEVKKPFKAADGTAFETRQELRQYEEENLRFICGVCKARFGSDEAAAKHYRCEHKPRGFLVEDAKAARGRGTVDQAWLELDLDDLYSEMHDLRTSIMTSLADNSVDADELDAVIRLLQRCDVPKLALDRLLVALGDGDTSDDDKALLLKYCPEEVPKQKSGLFDILIIYQGHLKLLFEHYSKNPGKADGDAMTKSNFGRLLKDCGVLGADYKKVSADLIFERVSRHRDQRNVDGTKNSANALSMSEFVNALVRVASAKFTKILGVPDKFLWLVVQNIRHHELVRIVDDQIIASMESAKVKGVFNDKKTKAALKKAFGRFGESRNAQNVLTLRGFVDMLRSCSLCDDALSERESKFCFLSVNDENVSTADNIGGTPADKALVLTYGGFTECLARMAFSKFSYPYLAEDHYAAPVKLPKFTPLLKRFLEDYLNKVTGLDFWQMKRIGFNMKKFAKRRAASRADDMQRAWKAIDQDDSGALDEAELQMLLQQMKMPAEDEDVQRAMEEIDADGSGVVEFEEFSAWFQQQSEEAQLAVAAAAAPPQGEPAPEPMSHAQKTLLVVAEQLGHDVATLLAETSAVRTAVFSVLSGRVIDSASKTVILRYLRESGASADIIEAVEDSIKRLEKPGGKLKVKAKKALQHYNITTSPEEEMALIVEALDEKKAELETVFVYYGTSLVYDHSQPLGGISGEGLLEMLLELHIVSPADQLAPQAYCRQLLDCAKRMRVRDDGGGAMAAQDVSGGGAPPTWVWGDEEGTTADLLTVEELRRTLVRIAYDRRKALAGGMAVRVRSLMADSISRHWCLTLDHEDLTKTFKSKVIQSVFSTNRTELKKRFKSTCGSWSKERMDISQLILYLEACNFPHVPQGRRLRFLLFSVRLNHQHKDMQDIWNKCLILCCKDELAIASSLDEDEDDREETQSWPLLPQGGGAVLPPEAQGAPLLVEEKKPPFSSVFDKWVVGGILTVPSTGFQEHLKKVRTKKAKLLKKKLAAEQKMAEKAAARADAAAAALAAAAAAEAGSAAAGGAEAAASAQED
jgi:hypothetical protein